MTELAEPVTARVQHTSDQEVTRARRLWSRFNTWPVVQRYLFILMLVFIAKQAIYVVVFPPFTGHDEVAHFAYLRTVATDHRVPVLMKDRLPADLFKYCDFALDWQWCHDPQYVNNPPLGGNYPVQTASGTTYVYHTQGWQYAANHPPLYYILMTPIYWATERGSAVTQMYALRVAAIPFGLLTVLLAYLLARALFPGDPFMAITVPTFVAFQPQISYEAAMVNNDIISIVAYSWVLYLLVVGIRNRFPPRICVLSGFAFGIALLAKGTSISAGALIAIAIIATLGVRNVRLWVKRGVLAAIPAGVLAAPWYAFLYHTYGNLSGFKQIEQMQWWNKPAGTFFGMLTSRTFMLNRFKETWGDFGWRRIIFTSPMLWAIAIPLLLCVAGLILYFVTAWRRGAHQHDDPVLSPQRWQWLGIGLMVVTCVIAYLAIIQFGTQFELTQARYYFPAINAAAVLLMLGLRTLIPRRYHPYGQAAVLAVLLLLNVMIFTQYVLPYYPYWG